MLVAISQRSSRGPEYGSVDSLERSYVEYFNRFDVNLIPIPNIGRVIKKYFHDLKVEGIILSGGGDVHPSLYGGDSNYPGNYSLDRDETEKSLLEIALEEDLPVLGICRGMQLINVHFGGKLIQSLNSDVENAVNHIGTKHQVTVAQDSITDALGVNTIEVNSYHNQGFTEHQLSTELVSFAIAEDQTIEGIYHPKYALAAVMWHPDRSSPTIPLDELLTRVFVSREMFWGERK